MTLKSKWDKYTEGVSAPQNYLDWGYLYLISACLQRRVWLSASHKPCFPNMYCILVGNPGVGKGITLNAVEQCLRFWKKKDLIVQAHGTLSETDRQVAEAIGESDIDKSKKSEFNGKKLSQKEADADMVEPLLFSVAPDDTSYQGLIVAMGACVRRISYMEHDEKLGRERIRQYAHSSQAFILQELGSLLKRKAENTITYLLGLYDCPDHYEYLTISRERDVVNRGCVNILAGTTPSHMQETFDEKLIGEGFTSRVFYVYATKNKKTNFFIPELTDEGREALKDVLMHIKKLASLYGPVKIDSDTRLFLENWWQNYEKDRANLANKSPKMIPYYARKNIHVMKIAMAMHFGNSIEMFIPKQTFKDAIEFLAKEEKNMHMALVMEDKNPQSKAANKIIEMLTRGDCDNTTITVECFNIVDMKGLEEAMSFLVDTEQIKQYEVKDEDTGKSVRHWTLVNKV